MAKIPLIQRTGLPARRVGAVKPPLSLADRSGQRQLGATITQFSGVIHDQLIATRAANEVATFHGVRKTEMQKFDTHVAENPAASYDELNEEREKMMFRIQQAGKEATTGRAKSVITNWYAENQNLVREQTETSMQAIRSRQEMAVYNEKQRNNILTLDRDEYIELQDNMVDSNLLDAELAKATRERDFAIIDKAESKIAVNSLKPLLIEAIERGKKSDGIDLLNTSTKAMVDNNILSEVEGAEANKTLGDWIDNYVAGRDKRAEDAVKLTTRETYSEFNKSIVGGSLTYDDIDQSRLLKEDKVKWQKYIKGSYGATPTENTPDGHAVSFKAAFNAATLQLSPTEAYDVLLEERFVKKNITDAQFEWAVGKIENPYPADIFEDLRAIMKSNTEDFNRFFARDKERNKATNEALVVWVDGLIAKDKVPAFDFKKKMYAMSSQFRVGDVRWYDVGEIVERNGKEWEVIGFDRDGEAIVEEVE